MDLKAAIGVAAKHAGKKGGIIILSDGLVEASTGMAGVAVPCPDLDGFPKMVGADAATLKKMVGAMSSPTISLKRATLTLQDGDDSFTVKCVPAASVPGSPVQDGDEPDWDDARAVTADECSVIESITAVAVANNDSAFALHGIRLTPDWAATCSQALMAVAWCEGLVTESVTIPATIMEGLTGELKFKVVDGRAWVKEEATGQRRWSLLIALSFPDDAINDTLTTAREQESRTHITVAIKDLAASLRLAQVVSDGGESIHKMTLETQKDPSLGKLCFRSQAETTGFDGGLDVEIESGQTPEAPVGVSAERLHTLVTIVASACDGDTSGAMSIAGVRDPVLVWGGSPVMVETLAMPCVLPGSSP